MGLRGILGGVKMEHINPHGKLIEKIKNNYNLIFHRHWTGFYDDKGYKELIKFEDPYGKFLLWVYVVDIVKNKPCYHKVEIRDINTAEVIAVAEGKSTPLQAFKLVQEVMQYV